MVLDYNIRFLPSFYLVCDYLLGKGWIRMFHFCIVCFVVNGISLKLLNFAEKNGNEDTE